MNNKYLDWINYQISNCKQAIELAKAVLDGAPPETLWVCLQNQHFYFYAYSEEEKRRQFIKKKDKDVAIRLADKEYCENLISVAQTALYHLNGLRQFVDAGGLDAAFTSMHPAKQNLIAPLAYTDANKIRQWEAQAYVHMPQKADGELTQKGERVRSKSELIYANIFVWLGIPYRYEQTIILKNGKVYSPDFVLYDVFTGKEILIEHFGRMDDPEYAREAVIKINDYIEDGYVLGDTFFYTIETQNYHNFWEPLVSWLKYRFGIENVPAFDQKWCS